MSVSSLVAKVVGYHFVPYINTKQKIGDNLAIGVAFRFYAAKTVLRHFSRKAFLSEPHTLLYMTTVSCINV